MRGSKCTPFQGGTRSGVFFRWPGALKAGVDVDKLAAHIDIFPTLAELAGAKIPDGIQLDGRSLVPLLKDAGAPWPDRYFFTHVGRWPKGKAVESKYAGCAVRNARFRFENNRELHDIMNDPGETKNVIDQFPEVVKEMRAAYDKWWDEVLPCTVENDNAVGPAVNPFKELYWKQFGGGPEKPKAKKKDKLEE
jgi:arylsulfatase